MLYTIIAIFYENTVGVVFSTQRGECFARNEEAFETASQLPEFVGIAQD